MSSNLLAKVERFACAIPHKGSMASWLMPFLVAVAVTVAVAKAMVVAVAVAVAAGQWMQGQLE